jgi:hypothetical protein
VGEGELAGLVWEDSMILGDKCGSEMMGEGY